MAVFKEFLPDSLFWCADASLARWLKPGANEEVVESAREACWRVLEDKGHSVSILDDEDVAVRALISLLSLEFYDEGGGIIDVIEYYFECLLRLSSDDFLNKIINAAIDSIEISRVKGV